MAGDEQLRSDARTRMAAEAPQDEAMQVGADLQETGSAAPGEPGSGGVAAEGAGDRPSSAADAVDSSGAPRGPGGGLDVPDGGVTGGETDGGAPGADGPDGGSILDAGAAGFSSDRRSDDPDRRGEGLGGAGGEVPAG